MKIWRKGLSGSLAIAGLAVLLAFSGCEGTTDEDSSGVNAYLAAHPYTSAPRDPTSSPDLVISPTYAYVNVVGRTVAFTVGGGSGSYSWGVSEAAIGRVESKGANAAIYTCLVVGNNDVIVQDDSGHYAAAQIYSSTNSMTVSPKSVSLSGGTLNASFTVSDGMPPYSWTSGNVAMGTVSYSASSSYVAAYTAVAGVYGQNVVTVIDAAGRTASATITQEP